MADWSKKFKAEYDYARGWLANADKFDEDWRPLVRRLHKLMHEWSDASDAFEALGVEP